MAVSKILLSGLEIYFKHRRRVRIQPQVSVSEPGVYRYTPTNRNPGGVTESLLFTDLQIARGVDNEYDNDNDSDDNSMVYFPGNGSAGN